MSSFNTPFTNHSELPPWAPEQHHPAYAPLPDLEYKILDEVITLLQACEVQGIWLAEVQTEIHCRGILNHLHFFQVPFYERLEKLLESKVFRPEILTFIKEYAFANKLNFINAWHIFLNEDLSREEMEIAVQQYIDQMNT